MIKEYSTYNKNFKKLITSASSDFHEDSDADFRFCKKKSLNEPKLTKMAPISRYTPVDDTLAFMSNPSSQVKLFQSKVPGIHMR